MIERRQERRLVGSFADLFMEKNAKENLNYYSSDPSQCEQILTAAASHSSYLKDNLSQIILEQCKPVISFSHNETMNYNECASRLEGEGKSKREVAIECILSNFTLSPVERIKNWFATL